MKRIFFFDILIKQLIIEKNDYMILLFKNIFILYIVYISLSF